MNAPRILAAVAAGLLLLVAACAAAVSGSPARAHAREASCPNSGPVVSCVLMTDTGRAQTGLQIADNPGGQPGTPFLVTDPTGAPMAWVNLYGLYSGGDGGKMPGGLICVSYAVSSTSACLTPRGTLVLRPTGPDGPTGAPVTLTPRDIRFLHRLEQGGKP